MSENLTDQLDRDLARCRWFSIQCDESVDSSSTAQLMVFIRMAFEEFSTKEELLTLLPLETTTMGIDIYNAVKEFLVEKKFFWEKNSQKRIIQSLRSDSGRLITDSAEVGSFATRSVIGGRFGDGLPQVSDEEHKKLEAPLSLAELSSAVGSLKPGVCGGLRYSSCSRMRGQLLSFLVGQAKMAVYVGRRRRVPDQSEVSPRALLVRMVQARLRLEFGVYRLNGDQEGFEERHHDSVKLIKFADDTTLIGLICNNDESAYRREVDRLVSWCSGNNLELNAQKTVEMIVDFRKSTVPPPPPSVMDSPITSVESFRFLGTTITQDLKREPTISSLIKKAQQRMYFLR
uniref:Alkylated DNA repair protein AlkB homologue 8 N-terminal domain-containing protein n=1 Tax=Knipowitschia caucasica TaxID=637954 RepID=A0AAV2LQF9_KNICA